MATTQRALVVGGNGFVGSAVCRACLARGWSVASLNRTGAPSNEPWTKQVEWIQGSAFDDASLKTILPSITAVVHTLGILLESDYKSQGVSSLLAGIAGGVKDRIASAREVANPLSSPKKAPIGAYERINRDSALSVLRAYLESKPADWKAGQNPTIARKYPFVYISAEDVFRPIIPDRYILTKREAESRIAQLAEPAQSMLLENAGEDNEFEKLQVPGRLVKPVFLRPSFIYDQQTRPGSAIPATLLGASSALQALLPAPLRATTAAGTYTVLSTSYRERLRQRVPNPAESAANLLTIPPIHVDTVAEAVCRSIEDDHLAGVLDVKAMKELRRGRSTPPFQGRPQPSL